MRTAMRVNFGLPRRFRIAMLTPVLYFVLGGSVSFISALLQAGFQVVVMDRDLLVLLGIKKYLEEENLGAHAANLHFLCVDVEQGIGATLRPSDAILIIRCLHHMSYIASALQAFGAHVQDGALLVILDTTKELLEQEISDRQQQCDDYKGSKHEAHDHLCLQGCEASGLCDETSVHTLVNKNGLADISDFHYPIPCPCGNWGCGSVMSYWLGVSSLVNNPYVCSFLSFQRKLESRFVPA